MKDKYLSNSKVKRLTEMLRKTYDIKVEPVKVNLSKIKYTGKMVSCNAIFCPTCSSLLFSLYRHHFNECKCGQTFIDGGFDYMRTTCDGMACVIGLPVKLFDEMGIGYPEERVYV